MKLNKIYLILISIIQFVPLDSDAQSKPIEIMIVQMDNFDSKSKKKLDSAVVILETVINSSEFRNQLSKINFKTGNRGLTNKEIIQMILTGQNDIGEYQDYVMDLRLRLYDDFVGGDEFGHTGMSSRITSTHRCYILNNDVKCYVSHLAHEYMHQIGFRDEKTRTGLFKWTKTKSVPYKIGRLVEKFIDNKNKCIAQHDKSCTNE